MFITCQECNTTFRLDERLLKSTGSKVRCSQCRYTFVATPPGAGTTVSTRAKAPVFETLAEIESRPVSSVEHEDQSLEGIDLAELDSILENDTTTAARQKNDKAEIELEVDLPSDDEEDELDELDLDFDFDAALEAEEKDKPETMKHAPAMEAPDDELSLNMDFEINDDTLIIKKEEIEDLDLTSMTSEKEPVKPSEKEPSKESSLEEDLDMAFNDLALGAEEETVQAPKASRKNDRSDDLDLVDLDLDLEGEMASDERDGEEVELSLSDDAEEADHETPEKPVAKQAEKSGEKQKEATSEDGLDFDFDLGDLEADAPLAKDEKASTPSAEEELDFDLDLDLGEPPAESQKKSANEEEKDELSLDMESPLEMDLQEKEVAKGASVKDGTEDLEELSFEMEADFDEKPAAETKAGIAAEQEASHEEEDIDLSDIEQMLEGGSGTAGKNQPAVPVEKAKTLGLDDEIDLSEIESAIDRADEMDSGAEVEEQELELDLDKPERSLATAEPSTPGGQEKGLANDEPLDLDLELELEGEAPVGKAKAEQPDQGEGELDLSDLAIGDLGEQKPAMSKAETVHSGDIELDFQIDEEESPPASPRNTLGRNAGVEPELAIEQTIETEPVEPKISSRPKPVAPSKRSSKIGIIVLLLLLLAAAAGGIYYAVMNMGVEIPYISDYLKPKPKDPTGVANLTTMDINSKFIENSQSGRLFVITGKVRNGYNVKRNTIRLQGKLFTKGKVLVKTEFSYAGIQISDQELAALSIAEIKQALNAPPSALDANSNVKPGQAVPFLVVFSDLPPAEQLDEFAVELISSTPGQ